MRGSLIIHGAPVTIIPSFQILQGYIWLLFLEKKTWVLSRKKETSQYHHFVHWIELMICCYFSFYVELGIFSPLICSFVISCATYHLLIMRNSCCTYSNIEVEVIWLRHWLSISGIAPHLTTGDFCWYHLVFWDVMLFGSFTKIE